MKINTFERGLVPEIEATAWLNTLEPLSMQNLRGKVVVIHAFQMLCPGCVSHGLPQASAMHELYADDENVQVIGLHSVFEHHSVMGLDALKVFVHEYQLRFPIAVDAPSVSDPIPITMKKLALQGTPSLLLIDKKGRIRLNHFGRLEDLVVGNLVGQLLYEGCDQLESLAEQGEHLVQNCDDDGCKI